jgi:xylulokinase
VSLLLGLDLGTTAAKGLLVRPDGSVVAASSSAYPLLTPQPGWTEQDPELWWLACISVFRDLVKAAGEPIRAIGLTGQMHGAVFLDERGTVLRHALLWNDQRTARECELIEATVGSSRLLDITGNRALTGFQAPKILWLRKSEPQVYARVASVLLPKDFIRFRLTGERATDASDASGTLLFDLHRRNWSDAILETLEIPRTWLPRVYEGPEITGVVSDRAASLTGLQAGTPVIAGGGDNAAAAVGAGVVNAGESLVSLGTSGVVFAGSGETTIVDPDGAVHSFAHAVPNQYHVMGVMLSAGGSLRWCRDILAPGATYDELVDSAARIGPGSDGVTFLPYLAGERTPHMNPHARAAWFGFTLAHNRSHLIRSVLEGVAFGLRDSLARIEAHAIGVAELRAVGNGMRNAAWRRIVCDVLNRPMRQLRAEEGPAFGAAVLASIGCGVHPSVDLAIAAMVRTLDTRDEPDEDVKPAYDAAYKRFTELYEALHPFMQPEQAGDYGATSR